MNTDRINRLLAALGEAKLGAIIIHRPENMLYFSGFTGEGCVIISKNCHFVITDSRYTEHAAAECPGFEIIEPARGMTAGKTVDCLNATGAAKIGFEDDFVSVQEFSSLKSEKSAYTLEGVGSMCGKLRAAKDADEIGWMKQAAVATDEAYAYTLEIAHEGMTEEELSYELSYWFRKHYGARESFSFIVAAGENGSMPHAVPGDRAFKKGDMVTLDFGCKINGYCSDMTRTFAIGEPGELMRSIYDIVLNAHLLSLDAVAPGKNCFDIDAIARDYIAAAGYGERFGHGLGHGVGLQIHEEPRFSPMCHDILVPGMVMTIEPGIYLPGVGGVRIEDTVLVTENGHESLFKAPKDLIII